MRIVLHTYNFRPMIGGLESATHNLALGLTALGQDVTVITDVLDSSEADKQQPYATVRTRSFQERLALARHHDIIHATGTFSGCFPAAFMAGKPFSWTHHSYRLLCIDGLGWSGNDEAPLDPIGSFNFHRKVIGDIPAFRSLMGVYARRAIARMAKANVAISEHMAVRQVVAKQVVIYNPVECSAFSVSSEQAKKELEDASSTFTYLGRLVTEKGIDDLIRAFAHVALSHPNITLKIIGSGPQEGDLRKLVRELGLEAKVSFTGAMSGKILRDEISRSGIFVIPSAYEEPMGIVAIELMAAGKPLIVSKKGGLSECAGAGCLTFPNRDWQALAKVMAELYEDRIKQESILSAGIIRSKEFSIEQMCKQYLNLFEKIVNGAEIKATVAN